MSNAQINGHPPVEQLVQTFCTVALALALVRLGACALTVVAVRVRSNDSASGPLRLRLVLVVAVALGSAVVAAAAAGAGQPVHRDGWPSALDGLPHPDRAYGGVRLHVVETGDSLWSMAGRGWPRLFRLNRDRLGNDPDLVHPGTRLRLPPRPARGTDGVHLSEGAS